jgi:hypothetical protein
VVLGGSEERGPAGATIKNPLWLYSGPLPSGAPACSIVPCGQVKKSPWRTGLVLSLALAAFLRAPAFAAPWPVSDIPPDPAIKLGVLPNGMRYAILKNQTPANAVSVRFSLDVDPPTRPRTSAAFPTSSSIWPFAVRKISPMANSTAAWNGWA